VVPSLALGFSLPLVSFVNYLLFFSQQI
jgi:hypothetical protein